MNSNQTLDRDQYVKLLSEMIAHTQQLQNQPPSNIPEEKLIADIVKRELREYKMIDIEEVQYVEKRSNLIIKYTNFSDDYDYQKNPKSLGFIGSHMDVVPANPEEWDRNPFELIVDEQDPDILWGRGTTDCLGHVALLTLILKNLAINDVKLNYVLGVVFIADEEHGQDPTIGIPQLAKESKLDFLKNGPTYWVDASDAFPTVACALGMKWELNVSGKRGHSGMPYNAINPVLISFDVVQSMLKVFKNHFPAHPGEIEYNYPCSSNMKPTQLIGTNGSVNQIPENVCVMGDVRLTPFYDHREVKRILDEHILDLNNNMNQDPSPLPQLHESFPLQLDNGKTKAKIELKWPGEPYKGILCDMKGIGFKLLEKATKSVMGDMKIVSCNGSLPLISELQEEGLDLQIIGYGVGDVYHANNEYCRFSGMNNGYQIMLDVIRNYG